jgi:hypothetical protein
LPSRSAQSSELAMVCSSSTSHSLDHFLSYSRLSHKHRAFIIALSLSLVQVPRSFSQAIQDSKWCDAMAAQFRHTWSLAELPPSKKPIGCK